MPAKAPKTPARIVRLLHYLTHGKQVLCHGMKQSEVGDEHSYWLEPCGKTVGEWTVNRALEMGVIIPNNDALFPGHAQTYRAAQ